MATPNSIADDRYITNGNSTEYEMAIYIIYIPEFSTIMNYIYGYFN